MKYMKYIMFQVNHEGNLQQFIPVIFPNFMVHKEVSKYFEFMLRRFHGMDVKIRSVGDVQFRSSQFGCIVCSGGSETLKLTSHADDADIIANMDYFNGLVDGPEFSDDDTLKKLFTGDRIDKALTEADSMHTGDREPLVPDS